MKIGLAKNAELQFGFRYAIIFLPLIKIIAKQAQIKALPIDAIESLAEALLDFKGMDDLEIWLRENIALMTKHAEV